VRLLYFCAAHHNINICIQHIPGITNEIADAISHFQDSHSGDWHQLPIQCQTASLHG